MNLTKKVWNTLSYKTRVDITTLVKQTPVFPPNYNEFLMYNYSHDFDYNNAGKALRMILSHCRLQEDGTIDVVLTINPTYGGITKSIEQAEKEKTKQLKQQQKVIVKQFEPCKWYIDYEYPDGDEWDLSHCWVMASSKSEAESEFWDDHSSKCRIINIYKA